MKRAISLLLTICIFFCTACSEEEKKSVLFDRYFDKDELSALKADGLPLPEGTPLKVQEDEVAIIFEEQRAEDVQRYAKELFDAIKAKGLTAYKAVYPEDGTVPTSFVPTDVLPEALIGSTELAYNIVYSDGESYFAAMIRYCKVTNGNSIVGDTVILIDEQTKSIRPLIRAEVTE